MIEKGTKILFKELGYTDAIRFLSIVIEKIFDSIKKMDAGELSLLYNQIKLMEMMKPRPQKNKRPLSIKKIHEMTSTSESSWADAVSEDREDRL